MYERLISRATGVRVLSPFRFLIAFFTIQDAVLMTYLTLVSALLARSGGEAGALFARRTLTSVVAVALACVVLRGTAAVAPAARLAAYRLLLVGLVVANYLSLRDVLPVIRPDVVDLRLYHLDLRLFGVEPALWLERFNTRPVIEWFSFFYFSYFWICFAYMFVAVWLLRPGRRTAEYAIGTALVYCVGQLGYMAVPGFGPVVALRDQFHAPIDGGFFWAAVNSVVNAGGAMKDIFPSLHTAGPVWFTLFAWRAAKTDRRFLLPAIATGFFAVNIILSTMLLRWHYAIDVVAGLALAFSVAYVTPRLAAWEESFRRRAGLSGAWSFS